MPAFRRASRAKVPASNETSDAPAAMAPSPPPSAPTTPERGVAEQLALKSNEKSRSLAEPMVPEQEKVQTDQHDAQRRDDSEKPAQRKIEFSSDPMPVIEVEAKVLSVRLPEQAPSGMPPAKEEKPAASNEANKTVMPSPSASQLSVSDRMALMLRKEAAAQSERAGMRADEAKTAAETAPLKKKRSSFFASKASSLAISKASTAVKSTEAALNTSATPEPAIPELVAAEVADVPMAEMTEAEAKAAADRAAAARRAELAAKSEAALLSMHLSSYLDADLETVSAQLADAKAQLVANEARASEVTKARATARTESTATTATLDEKICAYGGSLEVNERYARQCSALLAEVDATRGQASEAAECQAAVRRRVHAELNEAKERLAGQSAAVAALHTELLCFNGATAPQIAKMAIEVMRLTADASAKATAAQFAKRHLDALTSDLADRQAALADASALDAKSLRADATAAAVDALQEKLAAEGADLTSRRQAEANIDERATLEAAARAETRTKLRADRDALKGLVTLEDTMAARELKAPPADATPTQAELFEGTARVVAAGRAASGAALAKVTACQAIRPPPPAFHLPAPSFAKMPAPRLCIHS